MHKFCACFYYCQAPGLVFRLGFDFIFPCHKNNNSKNNKKNPQQNLTEGSKLNVSWLGVNSKNLLFPLSQEQEQAGAELGQAQIS